jgi:hypothetical protein
LRNKYTIVVLTTLLIIAGIGLVLKKRQTPQYIPAEDTSAENAVKDRVETRRALFQPRLSDTTTLPVSPAKRGNQKNPSDIKSDTPDAGRSDSSIFLSKTNSGRNVLQGNQHKQRDTQFTKIDFDGQVLPHTALRWSCARDQRTGLLWETKLFDAGISDVENRYSWYDPLRPAQGVKNREICYDILCDTHAYTQEMNRLELCGSTQWRLPFFAELETLLDRDYFNPVINQEIFFNTRGASYWTQSQLENNPEIVMQIDFFNGTSSPAPVHFKLAVRLVSD